MVVPPRDVPLEIPDDKTWAAEVVSSSFYPVVIKPLMTVDPLLKSVKVINSVSS